MCLYIERVLNQNRVHWVHKHKLELFRLICIFGASQPPARTGNTGASAPHAALLVPSLGITAHRLSITARIRQWNSPTRLSHRHIDGHHGQPASTR